MVGTGRIRDNETLFKSRHLAAGVLNQLLTCWRLADQNTGKTTSPEHEALLLQYQFFASLISLPEFDAKVAAPSYKKSFIASLVQRFEPRVAKKMGVLIADEPPSPELPYLRTLLHAVIYTSDKLVIEVNKALK
jgi:hypothetical protein